MKKEINIFLKLKKILFYLHVHLPTTVHYNN